jgi:hypothetical protein
MTDLLVFVIFASRRPLHCQPLHLRQLRVSAIITIGLQRFQGHERVLGDCDTCKFGMFYCWWKHNQQGNENLEDVVVLVESFFELIGARNLPTLLNEVYLTTKEKSASDIHADINQLFVLARNSNGENLQSK